MRLGGEARVAGAKVERKKKTTEEIGSRGWIQGQNGSEDRQKCTFIYNWGRFGHAPFRFAKKRPKKKPTKDAQILNLGSHFLPRLCRHYLSHADPQTCTCAVAHTDLCKPTQQHAAGDQTRSSSTTSSSQVAVIPTSSRATSKFPESQSE